MVSTVTDLKDLRRSLSSLSRSPMAPARSHYNSGDPKGDHALFAFILVVKPVKASRLCKKCKSSYNQKG